MTGTEGAFVQGLDDVLIAVGIVVLIVRQFRWRSARPRRMLRLPVIVLVVGLGYLLAPPWHGLGWSVADWLIAGELGVDAATGLAMGYVTRFRVLDGELRYRLTTAGLWLWLVFIALRAGSFVLAESWGARGAETTGVILLTFGVNRLAAALVVRRRARCARVREPHSTAGVGLSHAAPKSRWRYNRASSAPSASSPIGPSRSARVWKALLSNDSPARRRASSRAASHARSPSL